MGGTVDDVRCAGPGWKSRMEGCIKGGTVECGAGDGDRDDQAEYSKLAGNVLVDVSQE
jgi:hypothetical protein